MLQRLKQLLVILLLAGFAFQPALAGRFTQEDFEYVFGNSPDISFDFEGMEYLSEQEMEETKGEIAPAVIYAAIVAARVGVQAASKVAVRAASRKAVQEAARKAAQAGRATAQQAQQHLQQAAKFAEKATRAEAKGNLKQAEQIRRKAEEFTAKAAQSTQKALEQFADPKFAQQLQRQLDTDGIASVQKSLRTLEKRLAEYQQKLPDLKFKSSVEREIRTFENQVKTAKQFLERIRRVK